MNYIEPEAALAMIDPVTGGSSCNGRYSMANRAGPAICRCFTNKTLRSSTTIAVAGCFHLVKKKNTWPGADQHPNFSWNNFKIFSRNFNFKRMFYSFYAIYIYIIIYIYLIYYIHNMYVCICITYIYIYDIYILYMCTYNITYTYI